MSLRHAKLLIYRLKRAYGQKATYYVPSRTHTITTGAISTTWTTYSIKKAVLMPADFDRSFVYDLAYIAAAKNFTHGGFFDRNSRMILVDAKDLPKGFKPKIKHHIQFDDERYEIKVIHEQPSRAFYAFECQALSNAPVVP